MGPEDESLVARDGRVSGMPSCTGSIVGFQRDVVGDEAGFFGSNDVLDDGHWRGRNCIVGVAVNDDDLTRSDYRDFRDPQTGKAPNGGAAEIGMNEENAVALAFVDNASNAREKADVKPADSLVLHQRFLIGPIDHADLVVVNSGTEVEVVVVFPNATGDLLRCGCDGFNKWLRWRRRRQVRPGGRHASLDGECAGVRSGDGNGGLNADGSDHFARRGRRRSEWSHLQ